MEMLEAVDRFLLGQIEDSVRQRGGFWRPDYSSVQAYEASVAGNRERFRRSIGAIDPRLQVGDLELVATVSRPALVAENQRFLARAVRWAVLEGVEGEGLLLEPRGPVRAQVVALPDADWTPEMFSGLAGGLPSVSQLARRLAEAGCRVLVPTLIDRETIWSGNPQIRMSNQTHREFIYRQAYFLGRHLIGYEVQKVLAAVDYFSRATSPGAPLPPIGVLGYGEGGLLALYSAALDRRIQAVLVSGYFQPREEVWKEPVYRNVWGLLREFGDAEIAALIAPRVLLVEACRGPEVAGPPPPRDGRMDAATGVLATPPVQAVQQEWSGPASITAGSGWKTASSWP